ncbi:MAG: c-type cytochrome [Bacteroidia bacterium]
MRKLVITAAIVCTIVACKSSKNTTVTTTTTTTTTTTAKPNPADCATKDMTYASDIKAIIETNCAKCHNENEKAGYNFLTLESVKKGANNGELLGSIKHMAGFDPMPAHADKLDDATISKIECWINNGMK